MNSFVRSGLTHVGVLVVFLILAAMYFSPQLGGKVLPQSDIVQYKGMSQESRAFEEKTGAPTLWTNAMFGGMPTYQINMIQAGNLFTWVDKAMTLAINDPIGRFFVAMTSFYILMMCLGVAPLLGAIGGVAFGFTTNSLILLEAGHMTKLMAIGHLPLVAAGMLLTFQKKYVLGGLLFAVGLGLDIYSNHVQMTYYFALTLLVFGVAQLVYSIRNKELPHFARAAGVLILAGLLAAASAASNLLVTYEYSRDTMRGKPVLQADAQTPQNSESAVEGLAWDYAMQWSNNTVDAFASFIPGVAGGGSQEPLGKNSRTYQDLQRRGMSASQLKDLKLPLYWGALPFTSGPAYFGATVFLFFLMGLILVKGPARWWLALGVLLTFMLSMGKNLEWFNRFLFDYFPLFNKFRTPNSVLSITSFLMPALGFLALHELLKPNADEKLARRALYIGAGVAGAIALFFWLVGPSMFNFKAEGDAQLVQSGLDMNNLIADRQGLMRGDAFRSLAMVLLSGGLIWAYLQGYVKNRLVVIAGLGILTLFDLWTVGRRYVDADSFVNKNTYDNNFQPRPVDELILKDRDPNYRVLDLSVNTFNSASSSYFHKTIGGYHPAKLQRYQDVIERHISKNNQKVLNMLNTKYYIVNNQQSQQPEMQINMAALGNAWFINNIRKVQTTNQEIDSLNTFDPANDAIIHQEFNNYIGNFDPQRDSAATIKFLSYQPNHLVYESNAASEQLAVFSEIWYGPNKGWQAYVDGQPVEHIRANYILRAMKIPAGRHKIEFKFDPQTYKTGKLISSIFSSLIVFGLLGFVGYSGYQSYLRAEKEPKPEPKPKAPPAPVKPTATRPTTNRPPTRTVTTKPKRKK
jgi:hypothetical protein